MKSYRSDVQRHLDAVVVEKVWSERVAKLLEYASDVASSAGQSGRPFLTCIRYSLYGDVDCSDVLEATPGLLRSLVPSRRHCRW